MKKESQNQVYDNVLKRLFESHADAIIPRLLAGSDIEVGEEIYPIEDEAAEELNVEVLVPPRRNDRVYRSRYKGKPHVVHFEIEVSSSNKMAVRALIYHGLLVYKYKPPVMSVIIYPFEGNTVQSPYRETNGDGEAITFHFRVLPLWKLDAHKYLNERDLCMYALIPAMSGATREMHVQALEKMIKYYQEKNDEDELREHLLCFGVLMRRAKRLPTADIEEVLKRMKVYDQLIEEDDYLMALVEQRSEERAEEKAKVLAEEKAKVLAEEKAKVLAEEKAKVLAEEKAKVLAEEKAEVLAEEKAKVLAEEKVKVLAEEAEGRAIVASQAMLKAIVEVRFPLLARTVAHKVVLPEKREALDVLIVQIASAPDENVARQILGIPATE